MPALANPRHEAFCQLTLEGARYGWSQALIYAKAGYRATGHSAEVLGSNLLKNVEVQRRIAELSAPAARKAATTVQSLLDELEQARTGATSAEQFGAAVNAITTKARITGKLIDRVEVAGAGEFDACQTIEDCVRLMLEDQSPAEALELHARIGRELERQAADEALTVAPAAPEMPKASTEAQLSLSYLRPSRKVRR